MTAAKKAKKAKTKAWAARDAVRADCSISELYDNGIPIVCDYVKASLEVVFPSNGTDHRLSSAPCAQKA